MPLMQQQTGHPWIANSLQALTFGAVHHADFASHALYGLYSGWVVQGNRGRLTESIFAHCWGMVVRKKDPELAKQLPIWLPELTLVF